jgi:hypothetical protein
MESDFYIFSDASILMTRIFYLEMKFKKMILLKEAEKKFVPFPQLKDRMVRPMHDF